MQQRPWLFLPLLGIIPLAGWGLVRSGYLPTATSTGPSPMVVPSPTSIAVQPSPAPSPSAQASASPPPNSAKQTWTEAQKAINRNAKAVLQSATTSLDAVLEMRVAIAEGVPTLTLGASAGADILDEKGKRLSQLKPQVGYPVQSGGQGLLLAGQALPRLVWVDPDPSGVLQLGDRTYRGKLLLVSEGGNLWAVNYISLRYYLISVVGAEVSPSWDMEALKAQAVAARSYALVHYFRPASPLYHLGSTEYYQVYQGIGKEAPRTRQAVDATAGEFVSYRGGIVESLYAASDAIVMEAFQGQGMSQLGALNLAEQGYPYPKILQHYYPNTKVARVMVEP